MTVMRPTLAASPVSLTARHPSPGAMASLALAFKQATLRPPLGDTRAARPPHSTQPTQCHLEATSAARHALSLLKAWTPMTSSLVTWVTVTFLGRVCPTTTTTTSQMGKNAWESLPSCFPNGWWESADACMLVLFGKVRTKQLLLCINLQNLGLLSVCISKSKWKALMSWICIQKWCRNFLAILFTQDTGILCLHFNSDRLHLANSDQQFSAKTFFCPPGSQGLKDPWLYQMLLIVSWCFQTFFTEDKIQIVCNSKHFENIFPSALLTFITFSFFVSTTFNFFFNSTTMASLIFGCLWQTPLSWPWGESQRN